MERMQYAAMTVAAVTSLGLGLSRRPTKATTNEQPGTRKSQSLESAAYFAEMKDLYYYYNPRIVGNTYYHYAPRNTTPPYPRPPYA